MKFIESKQNPQVKEWKKLHAKKGRRKSGTFLIEGLHLIEEAVKSGVFITQWIFDERTWDIPPEWEIPEHAHYVVTARVMKELSEMETPPGAMAVCKQPENRFREDRKGRFLLIDAVQDPGNLGTLIRTADAAGLDGVVLGQGCVDPYNGKVLRATQGSLFHLPVVEGDLAEWIARFKEQEIRVFGTSLDGGISYREIECPESFALIVGNEGSGVDPAILAETDENLYVPIFGRAESLNVSIAAGILLYGLK
ncbi:MAG TPA: RNA methyltransferase [Bacillales bacterium]|nr:RNA methyltransferase [Bacillales bacterium]